MIRGLDKALHCARKALIASVLGADSNAYGARPLSADAPWMRRPRLLRRLVGAAFAVAAIAAPSSAWALSPGCNAINTYGGAFTVDGSGNGTDKFTTPGSQSLANGEVVTYSWSGNTKGAYLYILYTKNGATSYAPESVLDSSATSGSGSFTFSSTNGNDYFQVGLQDTDYFTTGTTKPSSRNSSVTINLSCALPVPVLGVTMTHAGNAQQGFSLPYTITPSTTLVATTTATVTAAFTLPTGMTYTSASGTGWTCSGSGQTGSCTRTASFGTGNGPTITLNTAFAATATSPLVPSVTLSGGGASSSASVTNSTVVNQTPASVTVNAGNNQSTVVSTAFATAMQVTVKDANNAVIPSASVTFAAPSPSGASGTFATGGTNTQTVTANGSGVATASTFTANANAGGPYTVTATSGLIVANFSLTNTPPAPTVTLVNPNSGSTSGGTSVTITGTNLTGANVTFGGSSGTGVTVAGDGNSLTVTTPSHSAGAVNVAVTTSGGSATSTNGYTYLAGPTITSVTPSSGTVAGGTSVTIVGTNLTGANVTFGGSSGTGVTVAGDGNSLTVTTPSHSAGAVNVVVTTSGGSATSTNGYTYLAAPTITSVTPSSGTVAGGTSVTIAGTNLTGANVTFGGSSGTGVTVAGDGNSLTVTTPSHSGRERSTWW